MVFTQLITVVRLILQSNLRVNALGFGDYADGFSPPGATFQGEEVPGCVISDDLTRQLGDPGEEDYRPLLTT